MPEDNPKNFQGNSSIIGIHVPPDKSTKTNKIPNIINIIPKIFHFLIIPLSLTILSSDNNLNYRLLNKLKIEMVRNYKLANIYPPKKVSNLM